MCGGFFSHHFVTNILLKLSVRKFGKWLVRMYETVMFLVGILFDHPVCFCVKSCKILFLSHFLAVIIMVFLVNLVLLLTLI